MERHRVLAIWLISVVGVFAILAGGCLVASSIALNGLGSIGQHQLPPPPPPSEYGTKSEIGTRGDETNHGALFRGSSPSDADTQERTVGGLPARFSGYTTWVQSAIRVPAAQVVPAYGGAFLRVRVRVFNRDTESQHLCACDFSVWTLAAGYREADAVPAPSVSPEADLASGSQRIGSVYLYVGTVPGPYFLVYDPDRRVSQSASSTRGVWRVPT